MIWFYRIIPLILCLTVTFAFSESSEKKIDSSEGLGSGTIINIGIEQHGDWPPFEFFQRQNGKATDTVAGLNVDLLNTVFQPYGIKFRFKIYPWKRCLRYLEAGKEIQMILPTSLNRERKEKYLVSKSVYEIKPGYFFLKKDFPQGLPVRKPSDLLDYGNLCGRLGYNYVNFGVTNDDVYKQARRYQDLVFFLNNGRCKVCLARYEIIKAYHLVGEPILNDTIGISFVPGVSAETFHFLISKNYRHGNELLTIIDKGIKDVRENGVFETLLKKYEY